MIYIDHKYIRLLSSQLSHFKQKADELYNFRCPICGDSQKNDYKTRGYVFRKKQSLIYKCHNCGDSRSLANLIKHVDSAMHSQYIMEKYKSGTNTVKEKPEFVFEQPKFAKHPPGKLLADIGAVRLSALPEDHPSNQFVNNRKLLSEEKRGLYYIDDEEKLEKLSHKYKDRIVGHAARLLLPFCDQEGNMTGLTGRALDTKGLRYLTLKFNEDTEPLIFGLENWDGRKSTIVVEGPLDSLFLRNCIAVGGADFSKLEGLVSKENTTIVFDNEPKNKEIINQMEKMTNAGWTICIWPEKISEKDITDMVIAGQSPREIESVINRNKFTGLRANFKLNGWKKC
jgi:predicted RNA-binding Zn-ribbon protein involved in translation (DUF1610 family)